MPLDSQHSRAINTLREALKRRAASTFRFDSLLLSSALLQNFPSEQLDIHEPEPDDSGTFHKSSLSTADMYAIKLDSATFGQRVIVLAPLSQPSLQSDLGREALTAVAHLKAHLERKDLNVDTYLFLVTPPRYNHDESWIPRIKTIERNELICRTYVWCPPCDSEEWKDDIETLLNRTLLALPFKGGPASSQALDPLRDILRSLSLLTGKEADDWEHILSSGQPGKDKARDLVEALERVEE